MTATRRGRDPEAPPRRRARCSRPRSSALRERVAKHVDAANIDGRCVPAHGLGGDVDSDRVDVDREDGSEAEPHGGDCDDARPAARIEQAPALEPRERARCTRASSRGRPSRTRGPGSTTTAASWSGAGTHGGPIQSPPARTGRWNFRPAISPIRPRPPRPEPRRTPHGSPPRLRRRCRRRAPSSRRGRAPRSRSGNRCEKPCARDLGFGASVPRTRPGGAGSAQRALQSAEEPLVVVARRVRLVAELRVELLEQARAAPRRATVGTATSSRT